MKRLFSDLAAVIVGIICTLAAIAATLLFVLSRPLSAPTQPRLGFIGDWRLQSTFGVEEQPLPPSGRLWRDYESWRPATNAHSERVYLARMGGAIRQANFSWSHSEGDTPLGAQNYTTVEFIYTDPTNGAYALSWTLRGRHDPTFLRFDNTERLYQLRPIGFSTDKPPKLEIVGIEGIRPER